MRTLPHLLCLLFFGSYNVFGQWWQYREYLPPDVKKVMEGNERSGLPALLRGHLKDIDSQTDAAIIAMLGLLIEGSQIDAQEFLRDFRALMLKRPSVALTMATSLCSGGITSGHLVDGEFVPGNDPERLARPASAERRNRWLALKLVLEVRAAFTAQTPIETQAQSFAVLARILAGKNTGSYWEAVRRDCFMDLTSLAEEPAIEHREARGYGWSPPPVGDDPKSWFFPLPSSFEASKSDGERWRWALHQLATLGDAHRLEAMSQTASVMHSVFTAARLPGLSGEAPIVGRHDIPNAHERALHTLDDDETVVISGGRLVRLRLPADFAFVPLMKRIALDAGAASDSRVHLMHRLCDEWRARWQYDRVAAFMKQFAVPPGPDPSGRDPKMWVTEIESARLRFEPHPPQIAGKAASLKVTFRNARHARFTARIVDMRKVIADIDLRSQQPIEDKKDREAWKWRALEGLDVRLRAKDAAQWFTGDPIDWETELPPVEHHWDQQRDVTTPLTQVGVYFIECDAGKDAHAQTLLWLDDIVVVTIPQKHTDLPQTNRKSGSPAPENLTRHLVLDAATGAPVSDARFTITGGRSASSDAPSLPFTKLERTTDAQGSIVLSESEVSPYHQWLMRVEGTAGRFHVIGPRERYGSGNESDDWDMRREQVNLFVISDQPAYRPGQKVKWKAWMRHRDFGLNADTNRYANGNLTVALSAPHAPNHMLERTMKFNAETSATGSINLPEAGVLGGHSIYLHGRYESAYRRFPVETFRKPEFVAEASVGDSAAKLGDKFEFKIRARYYSGAPLVGGIVRYHVKRQPSYWRRDETQYPPTEWDWLYRNGHAWRPNQAWTYRGAGWGRDWSNDPGGEVVNGLVPLSADGTVSIPVDTTGAAQLSGDTAQQFSLHAWVMDATQRQIELSAEHVINSQPCSLVVDGDRGYYRMGENGSLTLRSFNTAGAPVKVNATLQSRSPDGSVAEIAMIPETDGVATARVVFTKSGVHRLRVTAVLPDGQVATTERFMSVLPADGTPFIVTDDGAALDLQLRQAEHAPGDEAELLVTSRRADATVWLFVRAQAGVYPDPVMLRLKDHQAVHRIAITEADFPNFIVQAFTVFEGQLESVTRQVLVPPKHVIARVSIETDKADYKPGDRCRVKIVTSRHDGSPLQANVAFTAYDKALDAIAAQSEDQRYGQRQYVVPDIRHYFWGWRRTHVQRLGDSFHVCDLPHYTIPGMAERRRGPYISWRYHDDESHANACMADPASAAPGGKAVSAMTGTLNAMLDQTRLRTIFRDSIAWAPDLHTDAKGEAFVEFTLPQSLTTWSLRAWAVGPKTEVGQAEKDLPITSPLELRIASPRFLIAGDEGTVSASLVHSERRSQAVKASIEIDGSAIRLLSDAAHEGTVNADGSTVITWKVKAMQEGSAHIRIKAACQGASDGTEIDIPVRQPHIPVMENWDLTLALGQQERRLEFSVPANDRPDESRLELRLTPGTLSVIADALPYLAEYPHGCAEQTLNRFLPTFIAHRTMLDLKLDMKALREAAEVSEATRAAMKLPQSMQRWARSDQHPGWNNAALFDEAKVKDMVHVGLTRLAEMAPRDSNGTGGWGWFGGSDQPNIQLTALIVHGFLEARRLGIEVNDNALTTGLTALEKHEDRGLRPEYYTGRKDEHMVDDLDALVHAVLVESTLKPATHRKDDWWREAKPSQTMRSQLIERRDQLMPFSVARLALACHQLNDTASRDTLAAALKQKIKRDATTRTAWIDVTSRGTWSTDYIETQAALLRMLVAVEPKSEITADVARLLVSHRRQGRFWNSTRDTAACIEALAAYASATGEGQQPQRVEVLLDGKLKQKLELGTVSSLASAPGIVFDASELPAGKHQLTLRVEGGSGLSATVALQHHGKTAQAPSSAVKLTRTLWRIDPASLQANEATNHSAWWLQRTVQREPITTEHPLHPGDIVEIECQMHTSQPLEYLLLESPLPAGLQPMHSTSGWDYQQGASGYHEVRDDRICVFMERLNRGVHTIRLLARVEHAGAFRVPPATFSAMYSPSFHATTETSALRVQSAK